LTTLPKLAKLGDGLDESQTVMVGERKQNNPVKIGAVGFRQEQ
jgi:hypothetical protein